MSVEPDVTTTEDEPEVEALARRLAASIQETEEYEEFERAKAAVEQDEEVQAQISEFEQLRQEFMLAQQTGQATQEDVEKVQQAQQELHSHPVMEEFLRAKGELVGRLEGVNDVLSEDLPFEFADEVGGCCND